MGEKYSGLVKILGISTLLVVLWMVLIWQSPLSFLTANNLENVLRRTALFGVLGIGVAFVIISSGIDLSIGSLVCLSACLLALFVNVTYVPQGNIQVWQVRKEASTIAVSAGHSFKVGDQLYHSKGSRKKGFYTVDSIDSSDNIAGQSVSLLKVSPQPRRDQDSEDQESLGNVTQTYSVESMDGKSVQLDSEFPALQQNDKIVFVHTKKSGHTCQVDQPEPTGFLIKDENSSIDNTFRAVPLFRTQPMSIPLAILSVLGITLLLGIIHGLLATKFNMQPFVVTLCGLMIYRGLSRWLTSDQTVGFIEHTETLGKIGTGRFETSLAFKPIKIEGEGAAPDSWQMVWDTAAGAETFGIPYSFFIFVVVIIAAMIFLNLTVWGRHLQAVGRNEEAARYSGINTTKITILAYVLCAVLTGLGGIMSAIDSNSIAPSSFGNFYELYAIAAAVLGGCSLRGGEGSILGVVVGTALMQTLYNSIVLLKIPDELEFTIIGAVILVGVMADEVARMLAARFRSKEL